MERSNPEKHDLISFSLWFFRHSNIVLMIVSLVGYWKKTVLNVFQMLNCDTKNEGEAEIWRWRSCDLADVGAALVAR